MEPIGKKQYLIATKGAAVEFRLKRIRMSQNHHTRKLGFLEKYYVCRNVEEYKEDISVTGQYNHHIDEVLLSNALRSLILKNPVFALNIYRDGDLQYDAKMNGDNFTVRPVERIAFSDVVTFKDIDEPFGALELNALSEQVSPVNDTRPLWRLKVYKSSSSKKQYVTFHCDHTFFDGLSAAQFHKDLIVKFGIYSGDAALKFQETLFDYTADKSILPSILDSSDKIVDLYNPSILFSLLAIVQNMLLPKWLSDGFWSLFSTNAEQKPLYTHMPTQKGAKSNQRCVNIKPHDVKRLRAFCKSQGTTLTPYITAIAMYALQETVFPFVSNSQCSFQVDIPINGRRYFPDKAKYTKYGLYAGPFSCKMGPVSKSTGSYDDLKVPINTLTTQLSSSVADKSPFSYVGLLKYVNCWNFLASKIGKTDSRLTLEVSNLGFHLISHDNWSVENLWFNQTNGILNHFCLSLIATESNGLNLLASYLADLDMVQTSLRKLVIDEFMALFTTKLLEHV